MLVEEPAELLRERVLAARGDLAPSPVDAFDRALDEVFLEPLALVAPVSEDLARVLVDFRVPPLLDREVALRVPVERDPLDRAELLRFEPVLREPVLREPVPRDEEAEDEEPELVLEPSSLVHLPDITRCAASATASAINEPSLVALVMTFVAACVAVSAASSPASRIARLALGLALIAAAAAARPAASISLLIAALASLSTVSLPVPDPEPDEPLRADLAIASSPPVWRKRHFKAVTVPK